MMAVESNSDRATGPENPPSKRSNLGRRARNYLYKVLIFFLCGLVIEWLSAKLFPDLKGTFANTDPRDLFLTYADYLLKHMFIPADYATRTLKAFYIPEFVTKPVSFLVSILSLFVTAFTALYSTVVDFFHRFPQNPFNAVYAAVELLIGGLIALPKETYIPLFAAYPRLFIRVILMVLVGWIIGCVFYGIIWIIGAFYGFILNISLAIPYAHELRMAMVEERTHWLLDSTVGRLLRRGSA